MANPSDNNLEMYDSIMHAKSKDSGTEEIREKHEFPITRYSNILGAPHLVDLKTVGKAYPDEYLLLEIGELMLSDAEYNACFGELTTA